MLYYSYQGDFTAVVIASGLSGSRGISVYGQTQYTPQNDRGKHNNIREIVAGLRPSKAAERALCGLDINPILLQIQALKRSLWFILRF